MGVGRVGVGVVGVVGSRSRGSGSTRSGNRNKMSDRVREKGEGRSEQAKRGERKWMEQGSST